MKHLREIIILIFALMVTQTNAQIAGGIMAGVSTGSVKISEIPNSFLRTVKGDGIMGYEGGFFLKLNAGPFYGKPELLLNYRSGTVEVSNESEGTARTDFKMSALEVPVLFGLDLIGPLSIEAGPVYNYLLSVTDKYNGDNVAVKRGGIGYRIGANAELGRVNFNVSYQGIKNNNSTSTESTFESPNELIFGVGLKLGK